jgi:hypothetical protein
MTGFSLMDYFPGIVNHGRIIIDVKDPPCSMVTFEIDLDDNVRCESCVNAHIYIYGSKVCPLYWEEVRKLWRSKKWALKD